MKLAFFEVNEHDKPVLQQLLTKAGVDSNGVVFFEEKIKDVDVNKFKDTDAISVFVHSPVDKILMDELPNLKLINTGSTGFDHIDVTAAKEKNIAVTSVPGYGSRTVAEFTFALMLGLSRKAFAAYRQVKDRHDFSIAEFEGFNLFGKTLGVVGTGRIGQNVIKIAKGFEMNVIAFDAFAKPELATQLGFAYVSLDNLLQQSDIVTLHVPYNKDTHHLINKNNIDKFKKGALLINTSRGEVAETESLLMALENGQLSAAGMDVIEGERDLSDEWALLSHPGFEEHLKTLLEDHVLIDLPQVAYTPHIAFFTKEAKQEITETSVANILGFFKGQIQNQVKN